MRGLEATASLNRELGGETDLGRVLELVVKRGRALVDASSCVVLLADEGGDTMRVAASAGALQGDHVGAELQPGSSPAMDVLRAGSGQRIGAPAAARFGSIGITATAGLLVPLRSRGIDIGVLAAFDRSPDGPDFSGDDQLALESFATSAATAIGATRAIEDEKLRLSIISSERERRRWARDLHDETLQELGALNLMQESALQVDDPKAMRRALTQANEQVGRVIRGLQGLITELRPAALDQLGTAPALEALVERIQSRSGLDIEIDIDLDYEAGREPTRHVPELESTIYRLVQEALSNIVKHAGASRARISVDERDGQVTVTVEDNGRGFDEGEAHEGFGLLGMRERVALRGGELRVEPAPGGGTRVRASLPVERL
jgi:signal transduction histidine kinase